MIYFAVVLPFQFRLLSPTIGIMGILLGWLISFRPSQAGLSFRKNIPLVMVTCLFLAEALSFFYTENTQNWERLMLLKLPTFLLPLALGTSARFTPKHQKHWLLTFAFSVAFSCLILFIIGIYRYTQDPSEDYFYHQAFVVYNLISVHYFSMYCIFAFVILLYYLPKRDSPQKKIRSLFFISFLLIGGALYSGAARMQIATFLLVILVFISWKFIAQKNWKKLITYQIAALLTIAGLVMLIPSSRKRLIETYREWLVFEGKSKDYQTNHRVFIWRDAIEVIKEQPVLGTGLGSADDHLYEYLKLEKAEFWRGNQPYTLAEMQYNYHNTYLQHFAALGIAGIVSLLLILCTPFIRWGSFSFPTYMFLMILAIGFITESILERQAGTLFFAYFYAMLVTNTTNTFRPSALGDHKKPA